MSDADRLARVVNRQFIATYCNVSLPTVDSWVRKGCPVIERGSKGKQWRFDFAAVIDWRIKGAADDAAATPALGEGQISKDEADRRKAVAQARLAEIEVDEKERSVLLVAEANEMMADFCQALKSSVDNGIAKTAGRAAVMADPNEIREFFGREWNRSMEAAQTELQLKWAELRAGKAPDLDSGEDALADTETTEGDFH